MDRTPQVLIVGAGPVGLTLAVELARRDVPFRIVDKAAEGCSESRAAVLHARTLELYEPMGLTPKLVGAGVILRSIDLYSDQKRLIQVNTREIESPYPFILALSQAETEQILAQHLQALGIGIERPCEAIQFEELDGGFQVLLRHGDGKQERINVPYLAGCDGAHSFVRRTLNIGFSGGSYPQHFLLADVTLQWNRSPHAFGIFIESHGAMIAVPLSNSGEYRLAFVFFDDKLYTPQRGAQGGITDPTFKEIQRLTSHFAPCEVALSEPRWLSHFFVHHRIVEHYRRGNAFLLGDAAHLHSPLGGQGMNTGIQDAINLGWKLAAVIRGEADKSLLASYEAERMSVGKAVVKMVGTATRLLTVRGKAPRRLRNWIPALLFRIEPLRQRLLGFLSETEIHYAYSPIVSEHRERVRTHLATETSSSSRAHRCPGFSAGPKAGERMLDADGLIVQGKSECRLLTLLEDPKLHLLLFTGTLPNEEVYTALGDLMTTVQEIAGEALSTHIVACDSEIPALYDKAPSVILDPDQRAHERYGARLECMYLIRPDGYISFRSQPPRLQALEGHLLGELGLKIAVRMR